MKSGKRYIWLILLCVYYAAVLMLCLMKPESIPDIDKDFFGIPADKIVHFLMFLPYPFIAYIAFRPESEARWTHFTVLAAVFATGTGLAMVTEHLQGLSGYRSFEMSDFWADVIGMVCSVLITASYIIFRKRKDL